jgi:pimeloyl-ACP methyl ester carboxylesterase
MPVRVAVASAAEPPGQLLPKARLLTQAAARWARIGFTTRVVLVNGVRLHVAEAGHGDLVVLLHGYPQSGEAWRRVAPTLAKHYHVMIPDLRGLGLSEVTAQGYDLSTLAEDIHQLVQSRGSTRVLVAGHDWGGSVGAVYALKYRDEVSKLAFLESALPGGGFEDLWTFSKRNDAFTFIPFLLLGESDGDFDTTVELIRGKEKAFLRHLWSGFTADRARAPFATWARYVDALARPGVARAGASLYRSSYQSADEVRELLGMKLTIPVLSIAGEKGIGQRQESFVAAFADHVESFIVVPGSGHFVAEERAEEVGVALTGFFGTK